MNEDAELAGLLAERGERRIGALVGDGSKQLLALGGEDVGHLRVCA